MDFDAKSLTPRQVVWIAVALIGATILLAWGLRTSKPGHGQSAGAPDGDTFNLEREREHLQWMKKGFRENGQLADQLLHDPYWAKQWPLIADFQSDADSWFRSWAKRCDQESARGEGKRLGQCDTAMTVAITGFEVTVGVLKNFSPIQKQAVIDWPGKLPDERKKVRSLVNDGITNPKEQIMLYSELDRAGSYDDQIRDLLRRGDYDGSRILLGHSESIKDAVFAETAYPPSN